MKKAQALNTIRYEVATHGKITPTATRLFIENRISKKLFDAFVDQGLKHYNRKK